MPLTGKVSQDIAELVHKFKAKGKIGTRRPRNIAHAQRIASAIAFQRKRKGLADSLRERSAK